MKTYYLCDLNAMTAISGGKLPDTFGNINCLLGLDDEYLADLGNIDPDSEGYGFMTYAHAQDVGIDQTTLDAALVTVQDIVWEHIQEERDNREQNGGWFTEGHWFHSDEGSRSKYSTFISLAIEKGLPPEFVLHPEWKVMTPETVPMTVALVRAVRDKGIEIVGAIHAVSRAHKAAMEASTDPVSYDFTTGWPIRFGEEA